MINIRCNFFGFIFCFLTVSSLQAQQIDMLLKGGHVVDPKNQVKEKMDVAITRDKILRVSKNISTEQAKQVVDVTDLHIIPGLINMHTHVYAGSNPGFTDGIKSVDPDAFSFRSVITTFVDAGTSGWRTFSDFKEKVIDISKIRVLAFLNIAASGYSIDDEQENIEEMDPFQTADTIEKYPDIIFGLKSDTIRAVTELRLTEQFRQRKKQINLFIVESHLPEYSLKDQLDRMRSGVILTHSFEDVSASAQTNET